MTIEDTVLINKLSVRQLVAGARQSGSLTNPSYGSVKGVEGIRAHQKFIKHLGEQLNGTELFPEYTLNTSYDKKIGSYQYRLDISGRCDVWYRDDDGLCLIEIKSYRGEEKEDNSYENPLHWSQAEIYAYILLARLSVPTCSAEDEHSSQLVSINTEPARADQGQNEATTQTNRNNKQTQSAPDKHSGESIAALPQAYDSIRVCLAYVAVDSKDYRIVERVMDRKALQKSFSDLCDSWLKHTVGLIDYRRTRNEVNALAEFPYQNLREGQRFFMRQVIAAIRDCGTLFAQASTGSGKTMATIYPALKAQSAGLGNAIFYLTNMSSTKQIAEQAVADLQESGFLVRSLTLTAKEKLCLEPDIYCEQRLCQYALDYYERLPAALQELAQQKRADQETILRLAGKHRICPFELQLDYSEWCDIVIGDYNYLFDPRVSLIRFFHADNREKHILLIDEAHNLPARSRQMYSGFLELDDLRKAERLLASPEIVDLAPTVYVLNRLRTIGDSLNSLFPLLGAGESEFTAGDLLGTPVSERDLLRAPHFIGTRIVLDRFLANIGSLIFSLGQFLDIFLEWEHRNELMKLWFELSFYQRVAECFYDKNYITMVRQTSEDNLIIGLLCLDAAINITEKYYQRYPTIFFSATLNPIDYYQRLLYAKNQEEPADHMLLPSPFAPENRLVLAVDTYSVRYKDRGETIRPILDLILQAVTLHRGNYLVFCPSFAYIRQVITTLKQLEVPQDWQIMIQKPNLNEPEKQKWLDRFRTTASKPLLAFACMGSVFSEGIDLTGEQLIGVFVIGTGMPSPSPERELMRQYYEQEFGSGFHFAYTFPGFNRVMQAAGRLIRAESDHGIIVLLDDRYSREDYQALLPEDWLTIHTHEDEETLNYIEEFWEKF
ncbi:MAG TPA: ATP-dependent DNA helicase [Clostridiaceae bacterium]|nr:ATP-dependent DNA helicase [Clostridiaceae bacterium]